jgi:hypothetical protein
VLPIVLVVVCTLFQAAVTWWLWRNATFVRAEKIAQTKLIWLLPFLGAALVLSMLWEESRYQG